MLAQLRQIVCQIKECFDVIHQYLHYYYKSVYLVFGKSRIMQCHQINILLRVILQSVFKIYFRAFVLSSSLMWGVEYHKNYYKCYMYLVLWAVLIRWLITLSICDTEIKQKKQTRQSLHNTSMCKNDDMPLTYCTLSS